MCVFVTIVSADLKNRSTRFFSMFALDYFFTLIVFSFFLCFCIKSEIMYKLINDYFQLNPTKLDNGI